MFNFKPKTKIQQTEKSIFEIEKQEVEDKKEDNEQEIPQPKKQQEQDKFSNLKVHTMPEKFLGYKGKIKSEGDETGKSKISSFKKNIIIGTIIGLVILGLLGLGGWLLIKTIESPKIVTPSPAVNQNTNQEIESKEEPEQEMIEEEKESCSPQNCTLCNEQECLELTDYCHLEDLCQTCDDCGKLEDCPNYKCVSGSAKEVEEPEQEKEEQGLGELTVSRDSDLDLLTDMEEGLWGTDPMKSDTDSDGYNDGDEIVNLYDPTLSGVGTGKLKDSNLIKIFTNSEFGYSIYYPSNWQKTESGYNGDNIMFSSNTGEFVGVIVQENYGGYINAKNWYLSQNPAVTESDLEEILIGNWLGVKSPDKLNVYLVNNNYIYIITYNIGLKQELNYNTTFEMMLKSFRLFESPLD